MEDKLVVHPRRKAEVLARHFAIKLSASGEFAERNANRVSWAIRDKYIGGHWPLVPPIGKDEVLLAVRDVPTGSAPGPDKMPAEIYWHLPSLSDVLPRMFTNTIETNKIPDIASG